MKSRKLQSMLALTAVAALAGCATNSHGVSALGQEAYRVSVVGQRYETQTDANLRALKIARQYCDQMGKNLMFRQSTESSEHAWSPKQEDLTFVCMDANDPSFMRAAVEQVPAVIAQQE